MGAPRWGGVLMAVIVEARVRRLLTCSEGCCEAVEMTCGHALAVDDAVRQRVWFHLPGLRHVCFACTNTPDVEP